MTAPLRLKVFSSAYDTMIESMFNSFAASPGVEIVSVHPAMATSGPSEDQWTMMTLTVLYRDKGGA